MTELLPTKSVVLFDATYVDWLCKFPNATIVGDIPCATTSSTAFLSGLITASKEQIEAEYDDTRWVFLTDAQWVDYDPVLSRTLFKHGHCKLVVAALSPHGADVLPLVNLVRSNERCPLVLDRAHLAVGMRGFVVWKQETLRWSYAVPPHTPFDADHVWPVFDPWTFLKQHLLDHDALSCAVVVAPNNVAPFKNRLASEGFRMSGDAFRRGACSVRLTSSSRSFLTDVQELHVVDPPENLASLLFHSSVVNRTPLTVYLYVATKSPLEEPPQLQGYRPLFDQQPVTSTVRDAVLGLFVLYPMHHRYAVLHAVQAVHPEASKREILDELDDVCARKCTLLDQFGTEGTIVRSGDDYFFSKLG
jgi:hypothetical protein